MKATVSVFEAPCDECQGRGTVYDIQHDNSAKEVECCVCGGTGVKK